MKKTLLALAFVGALMVSCKEKTEEKMDEAVDAVTTEVAETVDSAAVKVETAADSATVKAAEAIEAGAAKIEEKAQDVKEAAKK